MKENAVMKIKIVNQISNVLVKKSMMMAHPIVLLDKMNSVAPVPHPLSSVIWVLLYGLELYEMNEVLPQEDV